MVVADTSETSRSPTPPSTGRSTVYRSHYSRSGFRVHSGVTSHCVVGPGRQEATRSDVLQGSTPDWSTSPHLHPPFPHDHVFGILHPHPRSVLNPSPHHTLSVPRMTPMSPYTHPSSRVVSNETGKGRPRVFEGSIRTVRCTDKG